MIIPQTNSITLRVDDTVAIHEFDFPFVEGDTAFDLLKKSGLKVGYEFLPEYGLWVTSIDGAPNEFAGGFNWIYEINLGMPDCSCGDYLPEPGDHVEFRYVPDDPIKLTQLERVPHLVEALN